MHTAQEVNFQHPIHRDKKFHKLHNMDKYSEHKYNSKHHFKFFKTC